MMAILCLIHLEFSIGYREIAEVSFLDYLEKGSQGRMVGVTLLSYDFVV